jgi:hypothetical protein
VKINFAAMTDEERTSAFAEMDNDALAASLTEARGEASTLFALTEPTIEQVNEAEALLASIRHIETEQTTRAAAVQDAADRFAAARQSFAGEAEDAEAGDAEGDAGDGEDGDGEDAGAGDEGDADGGADDSSDEGDESGEGDDGGDAGEGDGVTTASANHTTSQRVKVPSAASRVGRKTKRPAVDATPQVVITAAPDVQGFSAGQTLDGMEAVTKALLNRAKGFAPHNKQAARAAASQSGGQPVLHQFGVASFTIPRPEALVASAVSEDYQTVKNAIKARMGGGAEDALTAAGWCAPSENVYSYIADYVVDGLITVPEIGAPRGGINITTGPERSSQGAALDDFGWTQTEAQAEAGEVKPCEVIVCPDFVDHRLDAVGYCYKIPLLTQKAYPELITDALRFANVLYAHRMNRRIITDLVALSDAVTFSGYGSSFTDSLEALSLIAMAERRRWNVGKNAIMEVKAPLLAQEVYRADMSRRNGIAKDSVSDGDIARHFADRHLVVEYLADWQEVSVESGHLVLPGEFDVMMYPAGTFVKAMEDVINLSTVYDAATLSVNEYTGVFFEQAILTAKVGYGSSLVSIPINTAGEQGALRLVGQGDFTSAGSF